MSLSQSSNYSGASYLSNVKENWLFQLFNQDSYLEFDGVDDEIDCGATTSSSALAVTSATGMSVAFWVNFPTPGTGERVFTSHDANTPYYGWWIAKDANERIQLAWGGDADSTQGTGQDDRETMYSTTALSTNTWHFIVITTTFSLDTTETKIYIDNTLTTTANDGSGGTTTPTYGNGTARFSKEIAGTDTFGEFKIKNFACWNTRLDSANTDPIEAIYNSGNFLSLEEDSGNYTQSSNLVGYWEFNNGENFAQDLTGNQATGTITGAKYGGFLPLAYRDTKVDDIFYHGFASSSASIRHSINLLKSTSKTGNISISFINGKYQGNDLSKELFLGSNNYYNRTVKVFSQLNSMNNLDECLQLYHGRLTSINHDNSSIKLSIVSKSPWDNKTIPTIKSSKGNFFPIAYGNYTKNTSTFSNPTYIANLGKSLFPVHVENTNYNYELLIHKDIGSTDTTLHYYEENMDAFVPLVNTNDAEAYEGGFKVKTKYNLKRHLKFKPVEYNFRGAWTDIFNIIDNKTTDDTSTLASFDTETLTSAGDTGTRVRLDLGFDIPQFDDEPDSISSSSSLGLTCETTWEMTDFYGKTASNHTLARNRIEIINNSQYGGSSTLSTANTITDGQTFTTNGLFEDTNATGSATAVNVSQRTSSINMVSNYKANNGYQDGFVIRYKREVVSNTDGSGGAGTAKSDVFGVLKVYDVRFKATFKIDSTASINRIKDIKTLYIGCDGLDASWDNSSITLGHQAHRDLLIRFAGMPTIEPENYSDLANDRSAWNIRYWQNEEIDLIKLLEKLQYEFGFIHTINPSNGKSKYIWIHGTGTNNAFRAEDVVLTLKKIDISNVDISTTSLNEVVTKSVINTEVHPANNNYLTETTAINSEPRNKYNIKSKENISTINLDALVSTPATTPATDKQADFYSYYSQANGDVKKLIDCEIVNIQKGYLLEVGDVIKFDDMVVEPFGSDWNNYYMIVKLTRSLGKIKITAREVG